MNIYNQLHKFVASPGTATTDDFFMTSVWHSKILQRFRGAFCLKEFCSPFVGCILLGLKVERSFGRAPGAKKSLGAFGVHTIEI